MDPNEALKQLRELLGDGTTFIDVHPEELSDHLGMACEHFQALDEWIQKGGFLPTEWAPAKDVATIEEPAKMWTKDCGLSQYRVVCTGLLEDDQNCGPQYLTEKQYEEQLRRPNRRWQCPCCNAEAWWDDDWHEGWLNAMGLTDSTLATQQYRVTWTIELDAESAREAAEKALGIHRDATSIATHFKVMAPDGTTTDVDFYDGDEDEA